MVEYALTFFGIYFLTLFKFIAGPVLGHAAGYSLIEIMAVTVAGMMSSVIIFTYLGTWVKKQWDIRITAKRKRFTKKSRRMIKIWQKTGTVGVAFLTPLRSEERRVGKSVDLGGRRIIEKKRRSRKYDRVESSGHT